MNSEHVVANIRSVNSEHVVANICLVNSEHVVANISSVNFEHVVANISSVNSEHVVANISSVNSEYVSQRIAILEVNLFLLFQFEIFSLFKADESEFVKKPTSSTYAMRDNSSKQDQMW